jgi:hypothetical protein
MLWQPLLSPRLLPTLLLLLLLRAVQCTASLRRMLLRLPWLFSLLGLARRCLWLDRRLPFLLLTPLLPSLLLPRWLLLRLLHLLSVSGRVGCCGHLRWRRGMLGLPLPLMLLLLLLLVSSLQRRVCCWRDCVSLTGFALELKRKANSMRNM